MTIWGKIFVKLYGICTVLHSPAQGPLDRRTRDVKKTSARWRLLGSGTPVAGRAPRRSALPASRASRFYHRSQPVAESTDSLRPERRRPRRRQERGSSRTNVLAPHSRGFCLRVLGLTLFPLPPSEPLARPDAGSFPWQHFPRNLGLNRGRQTVAPEPIRPPPRLRGREQRSKGSGVPVSFGEPASAGS